MMKNLILYYSRKEENYAGGSIIRLERATRSGWQKPSNRRWAAISLSWRP